MKTQLLWGLAVLLLVLTASAQAYSNDTQEAEHLQKKYQGWPRFSDSEGFTPLELDYYIGFLGWSAVFLGAALTFTVVAIIVLCCGVCFCSCVRVPSGIYKIVVVVLILFFLIVTGFVGYDAYVGFSGENDFHEGILSSSNQTFTFVTTESDNVANLLEDIANYKGVFADKIEIPEELTTFSEDLRNITSDLSKFEDLIVVPVENVRHGMSLATFIVLCIICAANVVGILLRNRIVYIIGGMLAAIMIGVMMTSAAINIAPILFLSDACPNIDTEIDEHTPSFIQEQVQYMLFCNGTYEQVWWPLPQSINDTLKAINQSIEATNNQTLKEELRADYAYVFAIQLDAYRILSCNFTSTTYESLTETVCVPLFLGLHKLYKAELYACLFVTILLFLFIAAALRRHKEEYQEIPEYDVPLLSQSNFESTFTSPPPVATFDFSTDSQKHV